MQLSREDTNYKRKTSQLKKLIKKYVYENAALCDHVCHVQEKIICIQSERNYLFKKLLNYESLNRGTSDNGDQGIAVKPAPLTTKASLNRKQDVSSEKGKSRKNAAFTGKRKTLIPVPVDSSGLPVFPVNLGSLSVHSLGEIISDRPGYHDEDMLYPVGFCSTRVYGSLTDPTTPCIYTCMILDGGVAPQFQIDCDTDLVPSILGSDINMVHAELLRRINNVVGVDVVSTRGRGADFFGISHPTVLNLLQSSPGVKRCLNYKMTKFEINRSGETYIEENDASLTFECLQRSITFSRSHMDELDQQETYDSTATLRDLLNA